jgi:UDP-N-acetylmuramyl pentapeptide phosphotransferase/UDP-N-acetylglucosamine-1-phosphate transferase
LTVLSISVLDPIFAVPLIAAAFTVFASVGMTHAMNLIDGLNGLSSAIAIAIMAAFAAVAYRFGHADPRVNEPSSLSPRLWASWP